jgi:predicted neuraminidase
LLSEFIFEEAPFASAHASTIAASTDGVTAAWFGGPHEGHPQVRIWLSHKADAAWSAPVEVARGTDRRGRPQPCWNPVLDVDLREVPTELLMRDPLVPGA